MATGKIEDRSIRLGRRLTLFRDYATVLLVENNWDQEYIVRQWNVAGNHLGDHVVRNCHFLSITSRCRICHVIRECKSYGCRHLLCARCVTGYLEENINAGALNLVCPVQHCEKMMCPAVFKSDVSIAVRNLFQRNLNRSFLLAHPDEEFSYITAAYDFCLGKKWYILAFVVLVVLFFKGPRASMNLNLNFIL
ncbi:unnamed protein product [Microthlaspi erraticum]|uniref:RING-type domain-containing protein n=1 Tax=Microthlaspi erraticum TaxID=1685480 RepID=A0A6D2K245_9BRAS|nr:unnamed protein product [Microthlaspi erraticum]